MANWNTMEGSKKRPVIAKPGVRRMHADTEMRYSLHYKRQSYSFERSSFHARVQVCGACRVIRHLIARLQDGASSSSTTRPSVLY